MHNSLFQKSMHILLWYHVDSHEDGLWVFSLSQGVFGSDCKWSCTVHHVECTKSCSFPSKLVFSRVNTLFNNIIKKVCEVVYYIAMAYEHLGPIIYETPNLMWVKSIKDLEIVLFIHSVFFLDKKRNGWFCPKK